VGGDGSHVGTTPGCPRELTGLGGGARATAGVGVAKSASDKKAYLSRDNFASTTTERRCVKHYVVDGEMAPPVTR
jgi:hypothetical protein